MAPAQADQPAPETPAPWHAAYSAPSNPKPDAITREEVLNMMKSGEVARRDFILVDLRRTDHEAGLRHLFLPPLSKPLDYFFYFLFYFLFFFIFCVRAERRASAVVWKVSNLCFF